MIKIIEKLRKRVVELEASRDVGFETHSMMMEDQNKMILFIREHGLLKEFYAEVQE